MPNTGVPLCISAISVPQIGIARDEGFRAVDRIEHPDIFRVRTFGSEFLADDPMQRKTVLDHSAHHGFGRAVGFGDRVEIVALVLVLDAERGAKKGKDRFARGGRQSSDKKR